MPMKANLLGTRNNYIRHSELRRGWLYQEQEEFRSLSSEVR